MQEFTFPISGGGLRMGESRLYAPSKPRERHIENLELSLEKLLEMSHLDNSPEMQGMIESDLRELQSQYLNLKGRYYR